MTVTLRHGAIFVSGLLLGVAATWLLRASPAPDKTAPAPAPVEKAAPKAEAVAVPAVSLRSASCRMPPVLPVSDAKDGQYVLKADLSTNKATHAGTFVVLGKEAAAGGRFRDAEVAFLMSCRLAGQFKGEDSAESADARYQLGRLYAQATLGAAGPRRAELDRRAELLYSESLRTYLAVYGPSHEKTRFAEEGLARLKQAVAQIDRAAAPPGAAKNPASAPRAAAAPPASPPQKDSVAKAEPPAPRTVVPLRARPSFDCSRARSTTERLICSDPQLAQLDRELGTLHARMRIDSANPAAFRRRSDEEWRWRESNCRDKECLLDWYAERREQLLDEQKER